MSIPTRRENLYVTFMCSYTLKKIFNVSMYILLLYYELCVYI